MSRAIDVAAVLTAVGMLGAFGGWLHQQHAKEAETHAKHVEQEKKILDESRRLSILAAEVELRRVEERIDQDNKIRYHYEDKLATEGLSASDARRLQSLKQGLEEKYHLRDQKAADVRALKSK